MRRWLRWCALGVVAVGAAGAGCGSTTADGVKPKCSSPKTECDGKCVNIANDPDHCTECGKPCQADEVCSRECLADCPAALTDCDRSCVRLDRDIDHCGECENACPPGEVCSSGVCALSCQDELKECSGVCSNLMRDRENCGQCGTECDVGKVCDGTGTCSLNCQDGLTNCDGLCTDLRSDRFSCGACGELCAPGEVCNGNGSCALECQSALTKCGGTCASLNRDPDHCGDCGTKCASGEVCDGTGDCKLICRDGLEACAGRCVELATDRFNCGVCGWLCEPGQVCSNGACVPTCQVDLTNCGGVCANLKTSRQHCGACGRACGAEQVCSDGSCSLSCQEGRTECFGGCVDLAVDNQHCGGCGELCEGGKLCSDGRCQDSCQELEECNGACVNLEKDPFNCGECGWRCQAPDHARPACSNGECLWACVEGFGDCDLNPANGCERDIVNDGVCEVAAPTASSCKEIMGGGASFGDGIYTIDPDGRDGADPLEVYCDMTIDGGGWTVVVAQNLEAPPTAPDGTQYDGNDGYMHNKGHYVHKHHFPPQADGAVPTTIPTDETYVRLKYWPPYSEYLAVSLYSEDLGDGSTSSKQWKQTTNAYGETSIDLIQYIIDNFEDSDPLGIVDNWNDCDPHENYWGVAWFGGECNVFDHWSQADLMGTLLATDIFHVDTAVTGFVDEAGCGASWADSDCRRGLESYTRRAQLIQKLVIMVR